MSQADIDDIRARYEAVNAGDRAAVFRDVHPGFALKTPDRVPNAGTYLGAPEATQFIEDFWAPFEEVHVEPVEFEQRGDLVAVRLHVRNRHRGTSAYVDINVSILWTMKDGKPIRAEMYPEPEKAFEIVAATSRRAS
jgi:ketosteroid isomerase-like protein